MDLTKIKNWNEWIWWFWFWILLSINLWISAYNSLTTYLLGVSATKFPIDVSGIEIYICVLYMVCEIIAAEDGGN